MFFFVGGGFFVLLETIMDEIVGSLLKRKLNAHIKFKLLERNVESRCALQA